MNRLVIIGNGFDKAHGLPTSYGDFIDDYFIEVATIFLKKEKYEDELMSINYLNNHFIDKKHFSDIESNFNNIEGVFAFFKTYSNILKVNYKNAFLNHLIDEVKITNWVDIENEYYRLLKEIIKRDHPKKGDKKLVVKKHNDEFEEVKNLFEKYLDEKIDKTIRVESSILEIFKLRKRNPEEYYLEFPDKYKIELQKIQEGKDWLEESKKIKTYFLNFNYTATVDEYLKEMTKFNQDRFYGEVHQIQIHGKLNDEANKINFGFGDEMDEDYKMIENINDNEYLRNFKSFQYLQNYNYKKLLNFIESGENFQVLILGHSCGLSDRTLLNTVFEHKKCCSIKVYYRKRDDGTYNYTEMIQNISRHFKDKPAMRKKIVDKSLSQELLTKN